MYLIYYMMGKCSPQISHVLILVCFLLHHKGFGKHIRNRLQSPLSEAEKVDVHNCSGEDGHSKHRPTENIVRLFRPSQSWKPKKLREKNFDRKLCKSDWYVYYVRVFKGDEKYLYISVSKWEWKAIRLSKRREYSVVKLRRGFIHVLRNEFLSKIETLSTKKKNLKGDRFLIWSQNKYFDKYSFGRLGDITFEVFIKKALRTPHQVFQKVSQMCRKQ